MLVKLTRGNQLTIPNVIVKKAGLKSENDYLQVEYSNGVIYLKPVDIEERIPLEVFEKFKERALTEEKGDVTLTARESEDFLTKRMKKS